MANVNTTTPIDFSGGLNTSSAKGEIDRTEASLLRNWDITYKNQLVRREGLTKKGDTLTHEIDSLNAYTRGTAGKDLLLIEGGVLRYLNSNTWTALDNGFTSGTKTDMAVCPINSKIYISNQTDYQHSWDRGATTYNSCLTDLGTNIPHGNRIRWHKNHMFTINNVTVAGVTYPNRLYWSDFGNPDAWTIATNFIDVPGEGRTITMCDLGNSLVLFKERAIQFLQGYGNSDWAITATSSNVANLDEAVGCISPYGCTRVGNEVWFIDNDGVIRRIYQTDFDAFRKNIISSKIDGTLQGLNKVQLAKAIAYTWNDKVYFSVPNGSSSTNNLVLVFDIKASNRTGGEAWTTYTGWSPSAMCAYPTSTVTDLYIGDINGKVYLHDGNDDDGTAIDSRWDGKQDDFDYPDRYKRLKWGYISADNQGDIDIGIYASVDGAPFANLSTFNLQGTGSKLGPTGSFLLGPTGNCILSGGEQLEDKYYFSDGGGNPMGKSLQMSIRHNTVAEKPVLNSFTTSFRLKNAR